MLELPPVSKETKHQSGVQQMKRTTFKEALSKYPKEYLEELYYNQCLAKQIIFKKLNISRDLLNRLFDYYSIEQKEEIYNKSRSTHISETKSNNTPKITKEELVEWYINQDHNYREASKHFGISSHMFTKLCQQYNIKKDRSKSRLKGIKNTDFDLMVKNRNNSIISKYGSLEDFHKKRALKIKITYGSKPIEEVELSNQKRTNTCLEKYGVSAPCQREECVEALFESGRDSKPNIYFENLLIANNIEYSREFPLNKYRYDFKVNNTLIEINPSATHNSTWNIIDNKPKKSNYHLEKTKTATEAGYRCISIWDWDDLSKVIDLLKGRERVYARKCVVKEVDLKTSREFLNQHHLQGYARDSIRIGLYYNDNLVSIMTFGKPRYNKNYQYELVRYCSSHDVIGGKEKIFKYFIDNYSPESIISYCDLSKFSGNTYSQLGFSLISVNIGKHWFNIKTKQHITNNLLLKQGFDRLLGDKYGTFGKGTSNEQLMLDHGFVEIYDCGQATYIYKKENI